MGPSKARAAKQKSAKQEREEIEGKIAELSSGLARGNLTESKRNDVELQLTETNERLAALTIKKGGKVKDDGPSISRSPPAGDFDPTTSSAKGKGKGADDASTEQDTAGDATGELEKEKPKTKKEIGMAKLTTCVDQLTPGNADLDHNGKMHVGRLSTEPVTQLIDLRTNYFKLGPGKVEMLYRYTLKIKGETSARMRRRIICYFLGSPPQLSSLPSRDRLLQDGHRR
jgi:hypothetical protein